MNPDQWKRLVGALGAVSERPVASSWEHLALQIQATFELNAVRLEAWNPAQVLAQIGEPTGKRQRIPLNGLKTTVGQVLVWSSAGVAADEGLAAVCGLAATILERDQNTSDHEETLAGALHDLRSSVRRLSAFSRLLTHPSDEVRRALDSIIDDSAVMDQLFSSLGTWMNTKALRPASATAVGVALRQALYERRAEIERRRVIVRFEDGAEHVVLCEEATLTQILRSLLDNSLKFCPDPLEIKIATELDHDYLHLLFADNGPGVIPNQWERAFRPFQRLVNLPAGAGLGLALVRKSAMACSGWAKFRESATGLTVEVGLPLASKKSD